LCENVDTAFFAREQRKEYWQCRVCGLTFALPMYFPKPKDEKKRYDQHNNSPDDPKYRAYLNGFLDKLLPYLTPNSNGLDYGCGPGPTASVIMKEKGHSVVNFDPFYFPDSTGTVFTTTYDFITCSETAEHFFKPRLEFARFDSLLRPKADRACYVGVMTEPMVTKEQFSQWFYIRDLTHVCFYSQRTMQWIAQHHNWTICVSDKNITVFKKSLSESHPVASTASVPLASIPLVSASDISNSSQFPAASPICSVEASSSLSSSPSDSNEVKISSQCAIEAPVCDDDIGSCKRQRTSLQSI